MAFLLIINVGLSTLVKDLVPTSYSSAKETVFSNNDEAVINYSPVNVKGVKKLLTVFTKFKIDSQTFDKDFSQKYYHNYFNKLGFTVHLEKMDESFLITQFPTDI